MLKIPGGDALTPARLQKRLAVVRRGNPGIRALTSSFVHFVDVDGTLSAEEQRVLEQLLRYGPRPSARTEERATAAIGRPLIVVPRLGTISPWSSKATDIAHICGLERVRRIERGTSYITAGTVDDEGALRAALHDRMTESVMVSADDAVRLFEHQRPRPLGTVGLDRLLRLMSSNSDFSWRWPSITKSALKILCRQCSLLACANIMSSTSVGSRPSLAYASAR